MLRQTQTGPDTHRLMNLRIKNEFRVTSRVSSDVNFGFAGNGHGRSGVGLEEGA